MTERYRATEITRRRRGRPALEPGTPTSQMTLKLPETLHDRVVQRASQLGMEVNEFARRTLERAVEPPIKEPQNSSVVRPGRY